MAASDNDDFARHAERSPPCRPAPAWIFETLAKNAGRSVKQMLRRPRRVALGRAVRPRVLLLFVGNPRSGTTLVRSLLNAHPNVTISQELNVLRLIANGERSWPYLAGAILENAARFDKAPLWNGYDYGVPAQRTSLSMVEVLGDKKGGATATQLGKNLALLDDLLRLSPVPVRFLHCVRHPLDVIATKTRKNGRDLAENTTIYFRHEAIACKVERRVGSADFRRVYLEDLIADPKKTVASLCDFLGLEAEPDYIDACADRVFDTPRRSRDGMEWPASVVATTDAGIRANRHLSVYALAPSGGFDATDASSQDVTDDPTQPDRDAATTCPGGRLAHRFDLMRFTACVCIIHGLVQAIGLARTRCLLARLVPTHAMSRRTANPDDQRAEIIDRVRRAKKSLRHRGPAILQGNCLSRSLAIWWLLARRGIATTLHIGATMDGDEFKAHAWVEDDGRPLSAGARVREKYEAFEHDFARSGIT